MLSFDVASEYWNLVLVHFTELEQGIVYTCVLTQWDLNEILSVEGGTLFIKSYLKSVFLNLLISLIGVC